MFSGGIPRPVFVLRRQCLERGAPFCGESRSDLGSKTSARFYVRHATIATYTNGSRVDLATPAVN